MSKNIFFMGEFANISYIKEKFPERMRKRIRTEHKDNYCPSLGEIRDIFPIFSESNGNPFNMLDGLIIEGSYGDDEPVRRDDVSFVCVVLTSIEARCDQESIPLSGGSVCVECTVRLSKEKDGVCEKEFVKDVRPLIKCEGCTVEGDNVSFGPNVTTCEKKHEIVCKYGYKGVMLEDAVTVTQDRNGFNEWEEDCGTDRRLVFSAETTHFTKEGGMTEYSVVEEHTEHFVKRDWMGNKVDERFGDTVRTDVTRKARVVNPYDKRFVITDGVIICKRQGLYGMHVSANLTAIYGGLDCVLNLTQDASEPASVEHVLLFKENGKDELTVEFDNKTFDIEVPIISETRTSDGGVTDKVNNHSLGIIGKQDAFTGRITENSDGDVIVSIRVSAPNFSRKSDRVVEWKIVDRKRNCEPITLRLSQGKAVADDRRMNARCMYRKRIYMDDVQNERVFACIVDEVTFNDGTKHFEKIDPEAYSVRFVTDSIGSMIATSGESYVGETDDMDVYYITDLRFESGNMNDYFDFHIEVTDKRTGEVVYTGRKECIQCCETPVKEIVREVVRYPEVSIKPSRNNIGGIDRIPTFVLKPGKDGRMMIEKKR